MTRLFLLSIAMQACIASFTPYAQIIMRNKGLSYSLVGVILALGEIAAIILPLVVSSFADMTGHTKRYLSVIAAMVFLLAFPFVLGGGTLLTAMAYVCFAGLFWVLNPLVDGFINSQTSGDSSAYSNIRAAGTMTYVVTLILFALIRFPHEDDNRTIITVILLSTALFILISQLQSQDNRSVATVKSGEREEKKLFDPKWFSFQVYLFLFIVALTRIAQGSIDKLLGSYMTEELQLGSYFTFFLAIGAFCEFFAMIISAKLIRKGKVSAWTFLTISCLAHVVRLLMYVFTDSVMGFALAQTLHAFTFGTLHVSVMVYIGRNVKKEHYKLAVSLYWACAVNLPQMLSAFAGGYIIEYFGYRTLFSVYSIFPLIAFILCFATKRTLTYKSRA